MYAINKKGKNNIPFHTPGKLRPRKKTKTTDLDDNKKSEVRQTIYNMYADSELFFFNK